MDSVWLKRLYITQPDDNGNRVHVAEGCLYSNGCVILMPFGTREPVEMRFSSLDGLENYINDEGVRVEWVD